MSCLIGCNFHVDVSGLFKISPCWKAFILPFAIPASPPSLGNDFVFHVPKERLLHLYTYIYVVFMSDGMLTVSTVLCPSCTLTKTREHYSEVHGSTVVNNLFLFLFIPVCFCIYPTIQSEGISSRLLAASPCCRYRCITSIQTWTPP